MKKIKKQIEDERKQELRKEDRDKIEINFKKIDGVKYLRIDYTNDKGRDWKIIKFDTETMKPEDIENKLYVLFDRYAFNN